MSKNQAELDAEQAAAEAAAATSATKPLPKPKRFEVPKDFVLKVDKSRDFASVHGDSDRLGFIQDGIPFDKGGNLLREMLDAPQFKGARAAIERKIERRLAEEKAATEQPVLDTDNELGEGQTVEVDPFADIELVDWAYGERKYLPHVVYQAAKKRYGGKHFRNFAEVVAEMVKQKHVDPSRVRVA